MVVVLKIIYMNGKARFLPIARRDLSDIAERDEAQKPLKAGDDTPALDARRIN